MSENYNIEYREVSARPFLEDLNKSYDEQLTDVMQNRIMYNNMESVYKALLEANTKDKDILLSRCCIDVLAYARALNKGGDCQPLQKNTIEFLNDKLIILYTIPDFPMVEEDILRGKNEDVRQKTNEEILKIFKELNVPYFALKGSLDNRKEICDCIMKVFGISKVRKDENCFEKI